MQGLLRLANARKKRHMCSNGGAAISHRTGGEKEPQEHVICQAVNPTYSYGVQALEPRAFR